MIDEPALITALREGRIVGAGLDVFSVEPLPANHPLLSLENAVLISRLAGVTLDTWSRRLAFAFANARQVAAGQA